MHTQPITIEDLSVDSLVERAEKHLNDYAAVKARESAARDLLKTYRRERERSYTKYLHAFNALKTHPETNSTQMNNLRERQAEIQGRTLLNNV